MKRGIPVVFFLALVLTGTSVLPAGPRQIVAVFGIEDHSKTLDRELIGQLTEYLANEVGKAGVFQIVPPGDIKRALLKKKSESYKECFDTRCQVELGQELAANKTLSTSVLKIGGVCTVSAALYDLKRMATDLTASAKGECSPAALMSSVEKVAAEIRAWGSGGSAFKEEDIGEKPSGAWTPGGAGEVIVGFSSYPAGAVVLVDGNLICQKTPCSKSVSTGAHTVSMQAPKYLKRQERKVLSKGGAIDWKLEPNFGWLTVRSEPTGLEVTINGTSAGQTPINRQEREPGVYKVLVTSPCYFSSGKKVKVARGGEETVSVKLKEKQGAVNVKAGDAKGNDIIADVYVDGEKLGSTPGTYKVSVCAKELEIRHAKLGSVKKKVEIRERQVTTVNVKLRGGAGLEWVHSAPAGIDFTRSEVTVAQYRACVKAGRCTAPKTKSYDKYCNWGWSDRDSHPVNCVDWNQATAFCAWAGGRLPTEDEWYAEASNKGSRQYPWGDEEVTCDRAIWGDGKNTDGCGRDSTWPVCSKPRGNSVSGLCDMSGNLWEWTSSLYKNTGTSRVVRGGSWFYGLPVYLGASSRFGYVPSFRRFVFGFRCGRASR